MKRTEDVTSKAPLASEVLVVYSEKNGSESENTFRILPKNGDIAAILSKEAA